MSMSIKIARAEAMGDPGIGSFFKSVGGAVVGGVKKAAGVAIDIAPGPIGIVARKARGFVRGRTAAADMGVRGAPSLRGRVRPGVGRSLRGGGGGVRQRFQQDVDAVRRDRRRLGLRTNGFGIELEEEFPGGEPEPFTAGVTTRPVGCPPGMRPNKSDYWRRSPAGGVVFIEKGTVCVKSRRRNPLNPRALDRAVGRVASFARADANSRKKVVKAAKMIK